MNETRYQMLLSSEKIPDTEWSVPFLQGMVDRMSMSYLKYGLVAEGYPSRVNAIESLFLRLIRYMGPVAFKKAVANALEKEREPNAEGTRNTEFLMDVGNFAMIEFMHPSLSGAHFAPTDSDQSPGRIRNTGTVDADRNTEAQAYRQRMYRREGD